MINNIQIPIKDPVISDPEILGGTPVIKGTRVPASLVLKLLSNGYTVKTIRTDYPQLTQKKLKMFLVTMASHFDVSASK